MKCRSCWIDGSATFTIVASSTIISWPRHRIASAIQRRRSDAADWSWVFVWLSRAVMGSSKVAESTP